jgi:gamma-glutamyltranspeptidase/glutathione hydrolase
VADRQLDLDSFFDRRDHREDAAPWSVRSRRGVVVTAHYLATAAGVDVLEAGGNAVDAAVAASLALGVCESAGSGLGGGAVMLLRRARGGRAVVLSGPCRAPRLATPEAVAAEANRYRGLRAVAVPGYLAVIDAALSRYGTMTPADVLRPAIGLAAGGYPMTHMQRELVAEYRRAIGAGTAAALYLDRDGKPHPAGTTVVQPALASTLGRLAEAGFGDFYRGEVAAVIDADMRERGGFVRLDDLDAVPAPPETEPVTGMLGDTEVATAGPPAGGVALAEMCNVFSSLGPPSFDPDHPDGAAMLAELIRRCRKDRRRYRLRTGADNLGESAELLGGARARALAVEIGARLREGPKEGETSHLCVVDADGNVVSLTQSIERSFGAAEMTSSLGFLYNGFLRAFKVKNTRHPHFLRPLAPARSNASPSILLRDGVAVGAVGNTGSERLASGILQVLVRLRSQSPFQAVAAPRLHCTPGRDVLLEARFDQGVRRALAARGYSVHEMDAYSFKVGGLGLLWREGEDFVGVAEPRRDGAAMSPSGV